MTTIGVLGGGAWGTALASLIAAAGNGTLLWARNAEVARAINSNHRHPSCLTGITLNSTLRATTDLAAACRCDAVFLVVPAQAVRSVASAIRDLIPVGQPVICCAKGLEIGSGALMSEVLAECLPDQAAGCLSGPTFADEAAAGTPTAATLALADGATGARLARQIASASFRPYVSDDVIGTEVAGAVKNVLAIACGIAAGQGFGENTRAALITRGLAEVTRFAVALGGRAETLAGLAGIGDLAMTCASRQSRNFRFGAALGAGAAIGTVLTGAGGLVEGRYSTASVMARARGVSVEMPICAAVDSILNHGVDLRDAIAGLMHRPLRLEQGR